jgi:predicted DNA-binding ribbon-helix-helix protein
LQEICAREAMSLSAVVQRLETQRDTAGRTSTVRVHVLNYFRAAATELGHRAAGHGPGQPGRTGQPVPAG